MFVPFSLSLFFFSLNIRFLLHVFRYPSTCGQSDILISGSDTDSQQALLSIFLRFTHQFLANRILNFLSFSVCDVACPLLSFFFFFRSSYCISLSQCRIRRSTRMTIRVSNPLTNACLICGYYDFFLFVIVSRYAC